MFDAFLVAPPYRKGHVFLFESVFGESSAGLIPHVGEGSPETPHHDLFQKVSLQFLVMQPWQRRDLSVGTTGVHVVENVLAWIECVGAFVPHGLLDNGRVAQQAHGFKVPLHQRGELLTRVGAFEQVGVLFLHHETPVVFVAKNGTEQNHFEGVGETTVERNDVENALGVAIVVRKRGQLGCHAPRFGPRW